MLLPEKYVTYWIKINETAKSKGSNVYMLPVPPSAAALTKLLSDTNENLKNNTSLTIY